MSRIRSVYFRDEEARQVDEAGAREGVSANAVVRIAVRKLFGLPVPEWADRINHEEEEPRA